MKMSQLQSMLAINANLITAAHKEYISQRRRTNPAVSGRHAKNYRKEASTTAYLIRRLAVNQRAIKDEIKAGRTTVRVYKKHGKKEIAA